VNAAFLGGSGAKLASHARKQGRRVHDDDGDELDRVMGGGGGGGGGVSHKQRTALTGAAEGSGAAGGNRSTRDVDRSERATVENVMDPRTRLILYKMVNSGILSEVNGCVSTGKEANVYYALLGDAAKVASAGGMGSATMGVAPAEVATPATSIGKKAGKKGAHASKKAVAAAAAAVPGAPVVGPAPTSADVAPPAAAPTIAPSNSAAADDGADGAEAPRAAAIKVYKTSILVFKDREQYVAGEYRFQRYCKSNPRKMVSTWAEKEARNLNRLEKGGVLAPRVYFLRQHVLVMEFIGEGGWPAPRLKDVRLSTSALEKCYAQIAVAMRNMFLKCRLVHGDLSEFNMLVHAGKVYIIDVSQSVEHDHPQSMAFLRRDIVNINSFFRGKGVTSTMTVREYYTFVTDEFNPLFAADPHAYVVDNRDTWRERAFVAEDADGRQEGVDDELGAAAKARAEVDEAVFLQVHVPRGLNALGETGAALGNKDIAHFFTKMMPAQKPQQQRDGEDDAKDDGSDSGSESDEESETDSDDPAEGEAPAAAAFPEGSIEARMQALIDSGNVSLAGLSKEEKKIYQNLVKAAQRAKREAKLPKHLKKKACRNHKKKHK
jgi:RIO kinase 1